MTTKWSWCDPLPDTVILGKERGQWPIHTFEEPVHALHWVQGNPKERKLWKVDVVNVRELEYIPPDEGHLVERPSPMDADAPGVLGNTGND